MPNSDPTLQNSQNDIENHQMRQHFFNFLLFNFDEPVQIVVMVLGDLTQWFRGFGLSSVYLNILF